MIKEITVLMPAYNCAEFIKDAVQCVLNQTFREFELLIIDDGSQDDTEEIVAGIKDPRIKYMKKSHCGLSSTLNFGLKNASNEWIARMDADDLCHPERLEKQLTYYRDLEKHDIMHTWTGYFKNCKLQYLEKIPPKQTIHNKLLALHPFISHSSVLYNKEHILGNGGYDEDIKVFEDYELWLRIKHNSGFKVIPEILTFIRLRNKSLSRADSFSGRMIIYNLLEEYYSDLGGNFNINDSLEQQKFRGWREYFYGDKNKSRKFWKGLFLKLSDVKISVAYLFSYLPPAFSIQYWILDPDLS